MNEPAAVIGVGESEYSRASGQTEVALALTAIRAALADAGLEPNDVDGMVQFSIGPSTQNELADLLQIEYLRVNLDSASGAASAVSVIAAAAAAIEAGQASVVVCYRTFNGRSMLRLGHLPIPPQDADGNVLVAGNSPFGGEFTGPYGMVAPACAFAMWVRAYMDRYGISEERMSRTLGEVVVRQRRYAGRNPRALMHNRPVFDMDTYLASPIVASPLRKADLCLESDGACAFVVAGATGIARARHRPVHLLGTRQRLVPNYGNFFFDVPDLPPRPGTHLMAELLSDNGLSHADIDVLGIYDACSAVVVFDLESLGFCEPGTIADHISALKPAVNTSGGLLAEAYLQGMNQVIEIVRQLRGASCNQVPGARIGAMCVAACQGLALFSSERPK